MATEGNTSEQKNIMQRMQPSHGDERTHVCGLGNVTLGIGNDVFCLKVKINVYC